MLSSGSWNETMALNIGFVIECLCNLSQIPRVSRAWFLFLGKIRRLVLTPAFGIWNIIGAQ